MPPKTSERQARVANRAKNAKRQRSSAPATAGAQPLALLPQAAASSSAAATPQQLPPVPDGMDLSDDEEAAAPAQPAGDDDLFNAESYEDADEAAQADEAGAGADGVSEDDIFDTMSYETDATVSPFGNVRATLPRGVDFILLGKTQYPASAFCKIKAKENDVVITISPTASAPIQFEKLESVTVKGRKDTGFVQSEEAHDITGEAAQVAIQVLGFTMHDKPPVALRSEADQPVEGKWEDTAERMVKRENLYIARGYLVLPITSIASPFLVLGTKTAKIIGKANYGPSFSLSKVFTGQAYHFFEIPPAGVKSFPAKTASKTEPLLVVLDSSPDEIAFKFIKKLVCVGMCKCVFVSFAADSAHGISSKLRKMFPGRSLTTHVRLLNGKALVCNMFGNTQDLAGVFSSLTTIHHKCSTAKQHKTVPAHQLRFDPREWADQVLKKFPNKETSNSDLDFGAEWAGY